MLKLPRQTCQTCKHKRKKVKQWNICCNCFFFLFTGECAFSSPQTGAVFLAPHAGSRLALVITGNSIEGIRDAVHLATPTIPPMTRSPFSNMVPDYVITGPQFRARGPAGYLCAGFWNNRWEYGKEISSCVCWMLRSFSKNGLLEDKGR